MSRSPSVAPKASNKTARPFLSSCASRTHTRYYDFDMILYCFFVYTQTAQFSQQNRATVAADRYTDVCLLLLVKEEFVSSGVTWLLTGLRLW